MLNATPFVLCLTFFLYSFSSLANQIKPLPLLERDSFANMGFIFGAASVGNDLLSQGLKGPGETSGYYIDHVSNNRIWSISRHGIEYTDVHSFQQDTIGVGTGNSGQTQTSNSIAKTKSIALAYGIGHWWNDSIFIYGQGGYDYVTSSERFIPLCDNCYKNNIEVESSVFAKGGLNVHFKYFYVGLKGIFGLNGDINNQLNIVFGFSM